MVLRPRYVASGVAAPTVLPRGSLTPPLLGVGDRPRALIAWDAGPVDRETRQRV